MQNCLYFSWSELGLAYITVKTTHQGVTDRNKTTDKAVGNLYLHPSPTTKEVEKWWWGQREPSYLRHIIINIYSNGLQKSFDYINLIKPLVAIGSRYHPYGEWKVREVRLDSNPSSQAPTLLCHININRKWLRRYGEV